MRVVKVIDSLKERGYQAADLSQPGYQVWTKTEPVLGDWFRTYVQITQGGGGVGQTTVIFHQGDFQVEEQESIVKTLRLLEGLEKSTLQAFSEATRDRGEGAVISFERISDDPNDRSYTGRFGVQDDGSIIVRVDAGERHVMYGRGQARQPGIYRLHLAEGDATYVVDNIGRHIVVWHRGSLEGRGFLVDPKDTYFPKHAWGEFYNPYECGLEAAVQHAAAGFVSQVLTAQKARWERSGMFQKYLLSRGYYVTDWSNEYVTEYLRIIED